MAVMLKCIQAKKLGLDALGNEMFFTTKKGNAVCDNNTKTLQYKYQKICQKPQFSTLRVFVV